MPRHDLADVTEAILAGTSADDGSIHDLRLKSLVVGFGHIRRIGEDEIEHARGANQVRRLSKCNSIGHPVAFGVLACDAKRGC